MEENRVRVFVKIAEYVANNMKEMADRGEIKISSLFSVIDNAIIEIETTSCITIINQHKAASFMYAFQVLSKGFELLSMQSEVAKATQDVKDSIVFASAQANSILGVLTEYNTNNREDKMLILITNDGIKCV